MSSFNTHQKNAKHSSVLQGILTNDKNTTFTNIISYKKCGADNTWVCELHRKVLNRNDQLFACEDHEGISDV